MRPSTRAIEVEDSRSIQDRVHAQDGRLIDARRDLVRDPFNVGIEPLLGVRVALVVEQLALDKLSIALLARDGRAHRVVDEELYNDRETRGGQQQQRPRQQEA